MAKQIFAVWISGSSKPFHGEQNRSAGMPPILLYSYLLDDVANVALLLEGDGTIGVLCVITSTLTSYLRIINLKINHLHKLLLQEKQDSVIYVYVLGQNSFQFATVIFSCFETFSLNLASFCMYTL